MSTDRIDLEVIQPRPGVSDGPPAWGPELPALLGRRPWSGLLRAARPWHWVKNVFVLLPLPFAVAAGGAFQIGLFVLGVFGFCLVNSGVYVLNDTLDAEADR